MITRDSEISEHGLQVIPVTNGDVSQEKSSGMANPQDNGNGTALCDTEGISQNNVEVKKVEENDKDTESESKESENGIPVDRGWAWVIMISQFIILMLMIGYGRALSIFFLEFQKMFNTSVTMGTITFALMTTAFGVGNLLVTNVLLTSDNSRKIVIAGSLLGPTCICLSALSPGIGFFLACHFFIGLSNATIFIPTALLLGNYFNARRAFATSVGNAGISVGNLVFSPLAQYLVMTYGTRGAILLTGGVCLQSVIAASLCRPVSFYTKRLKYQKKPTDDKIGLTTTKSCDSKCDDDYLKETDDIEVLKSRDFERSHEPRVENGCQGKTDHARPSAALANREASSTPLPSCVAQEIII
ncbi:hypothetical protein C0Q70_21076 [Pomacea canaliculata]|uniref:Major facilitator superfamily (MFS) profile domain-containing protein n=2 Tax=Pomacea canaliculata TaxID=400727 RepID=A0A2T7NBI7_POMCA|nr:hypothetical protein C0Q70_21076 [Pomacea canaliculata]